MSPDIVIKTLKDAYNILNKPYPPAYGGALMSINKVLINTKSYWQEEPYFFGKLLWEGWGINEYLSSLLYWDDTHCFGLITKINRESAVGYYPLIYQAAGEWIREQANNNTIYTRYASKKIVIF